MAYTARNLVADSLRAIGAIGAAESPSAEDAVHALQRLNDLLGLWNRQGLATYTQTETTHTLTPGTSTYTIGATGTITATRPDQVIGITYRSDSLDVVVDDYSNADWVAFTKSATETGDPSGFRYRPDYPNGRIELYPIPSTARVLTIAYRARLAEYTLNDTIALPDGYRGALVWGLAAELAPHYGNADQRIQAKADQYLDVLKADNVQIPRLDMEMASQGDYDGYSDRGL